MCFSMELSGAGCQPQHFLDGAKARCAFLRILFTVRCCLAPEQNLRDFLLLKLRVDRVPSLQGQLASFHGSPHLAKAAPPLWSPLSPWNQQYRIHSWGFKPPCVKTQPETSEAWDGEDGKLFILCFLAIYLFGSLGLSRSPQDLHCRMQAPGHTGSAVAAVGSGAPRHRGS